MDMLGREDEVEQEFCWKMRFLVLGGGKNEILFVPLQRKVKKCC